MFTFAEVSFQVYESISFKILMFYFQMKRTANTSVPSTSLSASQTEDVFSELGSVTETRIVLTDQMKMKPFAVSFILTRFPTR